MITKTNFMAKIVLPLLVICLTNYVSAPSVEEKVDQVNYICQIEHWENIWCKKVFTNGVWTDIVDICYVSVATELPYKLRTIPIMMGCGYGQDLTHFLRVTTFTVSQCKFLSHISHNNAEDCWTKFTVSYNHGVLTILKLLSTYEQIRSLDKRFAYGIFYNTLSTIQRFLKDYGPIVQNTIEEILWINEQIMEHATTLESILKELCHPERHVLNPDELNNEFGNGRTLNVLNQNSVVAYYNFLIDKMNSYTEFINQHLFKLGYRTVDPLDHRVYYLLPDGSGLH